jgi:hypothetical protein
MKRATKQQSTLTHVTPQQNVPFSSPNTVWTRIAHSHACSHRVTTEDSGRHAIWRATPRGRRQSCACPSSCWHRPVHCRPCPRRRTTNSRRLDKDRSQPRLQSPRTRRALWSTCHLARVHVARLLPPLSPRGRRQSCACPSSCWHRPVHCRPCPRRRTTNSRRRPPTRARTAVNRSVPARRRASARLSTSPRSRPDVDARQMACRPECSSCTR